MQCAAAAGAGAVVLYGILSHVIGRINLAPPGGLAIVPYRGSRRGRGQGRDPPLPVPNSASMPQPALLGALPRGLKSPRPTTTRMFAGPFPPLPVRTADTAQHGRRQRRQPSGADVSDVPCPCQQLEPPGKKLCCAAGCCADRQWRHDGKRGGDDQRARGAVSS